MEKGEEGKSDDMKSGEADAIERNLKYERKMKR